MEAGRSLPLVIEQEPGTPGDRRPDGLRHRIRRELARHGGVLLRGFGVGGLGGFADLVEWLSGAPLAYSERSSPRHSLTGNVYTSTDYPAQEEIFLHNENSYQTSWPRLLFFYCDRPPATLGSTPLADIREVYGLIDPAVREEFARRGWRVVRNFHQGFGLDWREVFGTDDRAVVEKSCRSKGLTFEWCDGGLRTSGRREAVHLHPDTGEPVWFNHIAFFHHTTLPADVQEGLLELFDEEDLPTNTYYGDGGRIPRDVTDHLRACYRAASRRFDYAWDDVLVVDNMLSAHGREPFTGDRRIAVAMTEPHTPGLRG